MPCPEYAEFIHDASVKCQWKMKACDFLLKEIIPIVASAQKRRDPDSGRADNDRL